MSCKIIYKRFTNKPLHQIARMDDLQYLQKLKVELLRTFREANPYFTGGLEDFGGREITIFQNALLEKTGGRVSEKWFYTHLKKDHPRLPRIDVLDLLASYIGQKDWASFKSSVYSPIPVSEKKRNTNRRKIMAIATMGTIVFFIGAVSLASMIAEDKKTYHICFVDALTNEPIKETNLNIEQVRLGESSLFLTADKGGCQTLETNGQEVTLIVSGDYLMTDTITRILQEKKANEVIPLQRDDYTWMIHVFSSGKIDAWEKRRDQLNRMIASDAMIFQVDVKTGRAMDLFNKGEFIRKMTLPVGSLGTLEVLKAERDGKGKIHLLYFYQKK